jgi:hypothetical protein
MLECGRRNVRSTENFGVKRGTDFLIPAPLRCGQGFGPEPRKQAMTVNLCGKVLVFAMELHDTLPFRSHLLMESVPHAEFVVARL